MNYFLKTAKHRIFSLTICLLCLFPLSARSISGCIVSDADSTAVAEAMCTLSSERGTIASVLSASDGTFVLDTDNEEAMNIEVSHEGYIPTDIIVTEGRKNLDLGTVYLSPGTMLDEVAVTANKVIHSKGRSIVYPSKSEVDASYSSASLFQKLPLPGVEANTINESITIDGKAPMILIDGVPSKMSDLLALQPKDIKKVEYSRITPPRYADKGTNGLISVTLKEKTDGGFIYAQARGAVTSRWTSNLVQFGYRQGKSQFKIDLNYHWNDNRKVYDTKQQTFIGGSNRIELEENLTSPFAYHYYPVNIRYDFIPSEKTNFSVTFQMEPLRSKRSATGDVKDSSAEDYAVDNHIQDNSLPLSLDLFLHHDFNTKNSLEAQVVGTLNNLDYSYTNRYIYTNGDEKLFDSDTESRRRSLISEVSYSHSFSEKTSLSGGIQNTISYSRNKYIGTDYKPQLTENNNYIYANLEQQMGKVYLSLASGIKMFWVKNDLNRRHFIRNLSTVQLSWNINNSWNMGASFWYTPNLPTLAALTDYPQQTTPYLVYNGNPNLKPASWLGGNVNVTYQYKKFTAYYALTYQNCHNAIIDDITYMGDGKFLSRSVNASFMDQITNYLYLNISDVAGFGATLRFYLNNYRSEGDGWRNKLNDLSGILSVYWTKGPFTVSYSKSRPSRILWGHQVSQEESTNILDFSYRPNKHWTLSAAWAWIFEKDGCKYPSWNYSPVAPFTSERMIKDQNNFVIITIAYNTDFGALFRNTKRNLNNKDNASSILKL